MPRKSRDNPGLPDAELQILKLLWEHGPGTVRDLQAQLQAGGTEWAYTTVQTLLQRLVEKGCAAVDRSGTAHRFSAAVSRDSFLGQQLDSLAERICDGAAAPLLLQLMQGGRFTAEEIERFREMLARAETEARKREEDWC